MSILIKGMEMPKKDHVSVLVLRDDGRCIDEWGNTVTVTVVPPHGRLIDADALYTELAKRKSYGELSAKSALRAVAIAPTIIPAEGEET